VCVCVCVCVCVAESETGGGTTDTARLLVCFVLTNMNAHTVNSRLGVRPFNFFCDVCVRVLLFCVLYVYIYVCVCVCVCV